MWIFSIVGGIICIVVAVFVIRKELNSAIKLAPKGNLDLAIREELDELNASFFDIANDLEGKYSVHEKQISDLGTKLDIILKKIESAPSRYNSPSKAVSEPRQEPLNKPRSPNKSRECIKIYEKSDKGKIIVEDAARLIGSGVPINDVAKKFGIGVSELKLLIDFYKNTV